MSVGLCFFCREIAFSEQPGYTIPAWKQSGVDSVTFKSLYHELVALHINYCSLGSRDEQKRGSLDVE